MVALGKSGKPVSLGLSTVLCFYRHQEAKALAIHLENLRWWVRRSKSAAVMRSPWKIWLHSLKGKLLVTRMLPRS